MTDPAHWPDWDQCWLQAARANAILDEELGRPFQLIPTVIIGAEDQADALMAGLDPERFDLSACQ